jgi:hypothetical protein
MVRSVVLVQVDRLEDFLRGLAAAGPRGVLHAVASQEEAAAGDVVKSSLFRVKKRGSLDPLFLFLHESDGITFLFSYQEWRSSQR